jgi:hypothetical protein
MPQSSPSAVSHQTVRLARGAHRSAEHGACVMELASMLAGEAFGDHPRTACEVIGAFLRSYNDAVDDDRRQDLYPAAAAVVGTYAPELEGERGRLCASALVDVASGMSVWRRWRARVLSVDHVLAETPDRDLARITARALAAAGAPGHERALALVEDLVGVGRIPDRRAPRAAAPVGVAAGAPDGHPSEVRRCRTDPITAPSS